MLFRSHRATLSPALTLQKAVPGAGLEPARPFGQWILSPSRLPFRHPGRWRVSLSGGRSGLGQRKPGDLGTARPSRRPERTVPLAPPFAP